MDGTANDPRPLWMAGCLLALCVCAVGALVIVPSIRSGLASSAQSTAAPGSPSPERYQVPISGDHPSLGPKTALVTIVEWCDLGSRSCADADTALRSILERHPGQVRLVHRHLSERQNSSSQMLHQMAEGVHRHSDTFWKFRAQLLATEPHREWSETQLKVMVERLPANWTAIEAGFDNMGYAQAVNADAVYAWRFGVTAGLGIFVNGRRVSTRSEAWTETLRETVDEELTLAQALVSDGIALDDVYETLTRSGYSSVDDARGDSHDLDLASR